MEYHVREVKRVGTTNIVNMAIVAKGKDVSLCFNLKTRKTTLTPTPVCFTREDDEALVAYASDLFAAMYPARNVA